MYTEFAIAQLDAAGPKNKKERILNYTIIKNYNGIKMPLICRRVCWILSRRQSIAITAIGTYLGTLLHSDDEIVNSPLLETCRFRLFAALLLKLFVCQAVSKHVSY